MEENKKSIICILREMEKGAKEVFPLSKRAYILNMTSYRLKEKDPDKKWSVKSDNRAGLLTVTRTQ